jgi:putative sterol carrier protein
MNLEDITAALRDRVGADCGLGAVLSFDCGADGVIRIDGRSLPNRVSNDDGDGDCRILMSTADLAALIDGTLDPTTAYMTGRMQVEGSLGVALKLQKVLG